jgi:hypothetical protein
MTQAFTIGIDDLDYKAHSDVEGRTAQRRSYRRLSSSGYRERLSELLCGVYNPLKGVGEEQVA